MAASITRMAAIVRKEFIHISRDWRMIVAVLILPLVQLILFAYAISFDVRNVPTVVLDLDRTAASRAYTDAFGKSGFFNVVGEVADYAGVDRAFNRSDARAAIIVSKGFGDALAAGGTASTAVLVDGSEPNSAQLAQTYAVTLNTLLGQQAKARWASTRGKPFTGLGAIEPRIRDWYNPERRSADFLIPGLMVVIIMIVTVQQTAVTLVKEREEGTQEQLLTSPLRHSELILGKVFPWALLGFVDTVFITMASLLVFGLPLRGDVGVLAVGMFLFIVCALSLGLVISAVAPTIESANIAGLLISLLPGFMLSGMAFPLASIPVALQVASYLFPARYMVEIARGVFLRGSSWDVLSIEVLSLAVYAAVALGIATVLNGRRT